jgi:uncharacterized protein (DUF433 family)
MRQQTQVRVLGRHLVNDQRVCHGKPTFLGTRVPVADILEQVERIEEWNRSVTVNPD